MIHDTCNYYCQDGKHALKVLTRPGLSADNICGLMHQDLLRRYPGQALVVCGCFPAPEAPIEDWRTALSQRPTWRHSAGREAVVREGEPVNPALTVAWCVVVQVLPLP